MLNFFKKLFSKKEEDKPEELKIKKEPVQIIIESLLYTLIDSYDWYMYMIEKKAEGYKYKSNTNAMRYAVNEVISEYQQLALEGAIDRITVGRFVNRCSDLRRELNWLGFDDKEELILPMKTILLVYVSVISKNLNNSNLYNEMVRDHEKGIFYKRARQELEQNEVKNE